LAQKKMTVAQPEIVEKYILGLRIELERVLEMWKCRLRLT
jgi:hypothetical protein